MIDFPISRYCGWLQPLCSFHLRLLSQFIFDGNLHYCNLITHHQIAAIFGTSHDCTTQVSSHVHQLIKISFLEFRRRLTFSSKLNCHVPQFVKISFLEFGRRMKFSLKLNCNENLLSEMIPCFDGVPEPRCEQPTVTTSEAVNIDDQIIYLQITLSLYRTSNGL